MTDVKDSASVLGISPGNSYYKPATIAYALDALVSQNDDKSVFIFIPGIISAFNYQAWGYGKEKALAKAHEDERSLRNVVRKICVDRDYTCGHGAQAPAQIHLLDWRNDVENHRAYKTERKTIETLYRENRAFLLAIRRASLKSLQSRMTFDQSGKTQAHVETHGIKNCVDQATPYVLAELAMMLASPRLLNAGRVVYTYHDAWSVYEKLIAGAYDRHRRRNLSFQIVCKDPSL